MRRNTRSLNVVAGFSPRLTSVIGVSLVIITLYAAPVEPQSGLSQLKTRAERTNYVETSRYDDVVAFLDTVAKASSLVHTTTFGYTFEGRPLPLAVVGRVSDAKPATVRASGKLRIYIQANIHAGEVEGKESLWLWFAISHWATTPSGWIRWFFSSRRSTTPMGTSA